MARSTIATPFVVLLTLLAGCSAMRTHEARNPHGALVGSNVLDLVQSVGIPDRR